MSATLAPPVPLGSPPGANAGRSSPWLIGPIVDSLFIANLAWPLLVWFQFREGFDGKSSIAFWQLYYITTPHRWITLLLVFTDRSRLIERPRTFVAVAVAIIAVCLGLRFTTGTLTCLLAIDYIWNAWHFAAQHHGIYRIYGRQGGQPVAPLWEKVVMRGFLLYVILRVATATWSDPQWHARLGYVDGVAALLAVGLLLVALVRPAGRTLGGALYLTSVCTLFLALLVSVHFRWYGTLLALATASAIFHAVEYLALVGWSVRQRHTAQGREMGMLGYLVPRWGLTLAVFILILGAGGWLLDQNYLELWLTINVMVAFMHYTYDGLIWRRALPRKGLTA
jgi:hypothetical protein